MQQKPESCKGCPFYKTGKYFGFIPDDVPSTSQVVLIHDIPDMKTAADDASETWESRYFKMTFAPYLGLEPYQIGYAHILRCKHPIGSKGKTLAAAKEHCRRHDDFGENNLVVTTGPSGWKLLGGNQGGSRKEWRSFFVDVPYRWANETNSSDGSDDSGAGEIVGDGT